MTEHAQPTQPPQSSGSVTSAASVSTTSPVLAATPWRTSAELIVDCARLGYLHREWATVDVTYGRGVWWKRWRPDTLVAHDLKLDGVDYRKLPEGDRTYDAVAFDPPYICTGGRKTTGLPDFCDRFGLTDAPSTPQALLEHNLDGITECWRVLKPGGALLVKYANQVSSGKFFDGVHHVTAHAYALGLTKTAEFVMYGPPRPQPRRIRKDGQPAEQQHPRNNASVLLVMRKPSR